MPPPLYRSEKAEKQEKHEKNEKNEKTEKGEQQEKFEKQEYGVLGPLVGGAILILVGFMLYLEVSGILSIRSVFPFFLIIIGAIVLLAVAIGAVMAKGRNPEP
jgi:predicted lipid-binding transport protein (Tim44 family)